MRSPYIEYVFDEATGLFRRSKRSDTIAPSVVAVGDEAWVPALRTALSYPIEVVKPVDVPHGSGAIVFVDANRLSELDEPGVPVVCVLDGKDTLPKIVSTLGRTPWVSHYASTTLLGRPLGARHFGELVKQLVGGDKPARHGTERIGRIALLTETAKRESRFERMRDLFERSGMGTRTVDKLHDVYEELVTNALYDAPYEAGYFKAPVPRTQSVSLPIELACQISYGVEDGVAFLRVRDPFGALTMRRLLDVFDRCLREQAHLDESRGGAGLGMWRVFSASSTIAINVIPGALTEVSVRIENGSRKQPLLAADFHFAPAAACDAPVVGRVDGDLGLLDHSVTLVRVA